jgi:hypothetical protein
MRRLLGLVGATGGSAVGWWLGARIGPMAAAMISAVGTGVGLWMGLRVAGDHFD